MLTATQISSLNRIIAEEGAEVESCHNIHLAKPAVFADYVKQSMRDEAYPMSPYIFISRNDRVEIATGQERPNNKSHVARDISCALVAVLVRLGKEHIQFGLKSQEWLKAQLHNQVMQDVARKALAKYPS